MSIKGRVKSLEDKSGVRRGADGECACLIPQFEVRIYDYPNSHAKADADTREPETCEACGGQKSLFKVVYADERREPLAA
jgi:hypothetical protein